MNRDAPGLEETPIVVVEGTAIKVEIEEDNIDTELEGTAIKLEIKEEKMDTEDPLSDQNHQGKLFYFKWS